MCVWWDQRGLIYYELVKPGETVNTIRYQQQLVNLERAVREKRPETKRRHEKVILLHDNAPAHTAKPVRETLTSFSWEVSPHPPYSPDLALSDYHLFASLGHALKNQRFSNYEEIGNWLKNWFASKDEEFYRKGIRNLPKRWAKCLQSERDYIE